MGVEAGHEAGDQTRLEANQNIRDQVKLEAKNRDQVRNEASQTAGDRTRDKTDQINTDHIILEAKNKYGDQENYEASTIAGDHMENEAGRFAGDQLKTKRYKYNDKGEIIDLHNRLIVPLVKIKEIIEANHDHMLAGHLGIAKTLARIKRQYKWPQMKQHIVLHIKSC
jgi:hypothetical protein